ncbi:MULTISPECIES: hypothetical protein, partial [unclassified Oceanispirochaeta]|uniref:hypothetical protein n=1 Tax=unclassified Oceanispirochaeta TaxID=2635722 RepID=UPI001C132951
RKCIQLIDNKRTPYNNIFEDFPGSRRCPFIPGRAVRFRRNPHYHVHNLKVAHRGGLDATKRVQRYAVP